MSATRWVEGNPESNSGTVLLLEDVCAETESNHRPKPLTRVREALRSLRYSRRTVQAYRTPFDPHPRSESSSPSLSGALWTIRKEECGGVLCGNHIRRANISNASLTT